MPFEPLDEPEKSWVKPICRDPQHDPPNMIVITKSCKWVCPSCGASVVLQPSRAYWCAGQNPATSSPLPEPPSCLLDALS